MTLCSGLLHVRRRLDVEHNFYFQDPNKIGSCGTAVPPNAHVQSLRKEGPQQEDMRVGQASAETWLIDEGGATICQLTRRRRDREFVVSVRVDSTRVTCDMF